MDRLEVKSSEHEWTMFLSEVEDFDVQHVQGKGKFAFGFVEGPLIKALRNGAWYATLVICDSSSLIIHLLGYC